MYKCNSTTITFMSVPCYLFLICGFLFVVSYLCLLICVFLCLTSALQVPYKSLLVRGPKDPFRTKVPSRKCLHKCLHIRLLLVISSFYISQSSIKSLFGDVYEHVRSIFFYYWNGCTYFQL